MNEQFKKAIAELDGYNVPDNIKVRALAIMTRFQINGLSDGPYISNVIAYESGTGDGAGNFTGGDVANIDRIADFLTRAYGCNIFKDDRADLIDILQNGTITYNRMIDGLRKYIKHCRGEIERFKGRDGFRVDFARKCISWAADTIDDLKCVNTMCVDCWKWRIACDGTKCQTWTGCAIKGAKI